jgi:Phage terminase, small subunit
MTRKSGPAPLPANVLKLRGSYVPKDRRNPPEPPKAENDLSPPTYLDKVGAREWRRIAPILQRLGLLTVADIPLVAQWCQAVSDAETAAVEIARIMRLRTITNRRFDAEVRATLKNWHSVGDRAANRMLKISQRFGFTPADRVGLDTGEPPAAGNLTESNPSDPPTEGRGQWGGLLA